MPKKYLQDMLRQKITREANVQNFAKTAKVTATHTGGLYSIETSTGQVMTKLSTVGTNTKFQIGQWVTIEMFGGDWAVAGIAALKGGD